MEYNFSLQNEQDPAVATIMKQRTRWINGVNCQWIGREKEPGKGEGSSGLEFDKVVY